MRWCCAEPSSTCATARRWRRRSRITPSWSARTTAATPGSPIAPTVAHVEDGSAQHHLITLGGHRGRQGSPGDQLEPEVMERHADVLEERRLVAAGQLAAQR